MRAICLLASSVAGHITKKSLFTSKQRHTCVLHQALLKHHYLMCRQDNYEYEKQEYAARHQTPEPDWHSGIAAVFRTAVVIF